MQMQQQGDSTCNEWLDDDSTSSSLWRIENDFDCFPTSSSAPSWEPAPRNKRRKLLADKERTSAGTIVCDERRIHPAWPTSGDVLIAKCERFCHYCSAHRKEAKQLRIHVNEAHKKKAGMDINVLPASSGRRVTRCKHPLVTSAAETSMQSSYQKSCITWKPPNDPFPSYNYQEPHFTAQSLDVKCSSDYASGSFPKKLPPYATAHEIRELRQMLVYSEMTAKADQIIATELRDLSNKAEHIMFDEILCIHALRLLDIRMRLLQEAVLHGDDEAVQEMERQLFHFHRTSVDLTLYTTEFDFGLVLTQDEAQQLTERMIATLPERSSFHVYNSLSQINQTNQLIAVFVRLRFVNPSPLLQKTFPALLLLGIGKRNLKELKKIEEQYLKGTEMIEQILRDILWIAKAAKNLREMSRGL